jgi:hypothetical protein
MFSCKMNLPSSLFPSIDLTYVEDKYSKMQANSIWDAWDSLRGGDRNLFNELHKFNEDAKVWYCILYLLYLFLIRIFITFY